MSRWSQVQRWLIVAGLVTAWTCSTVQAEDVVQTAAETPPFWVAGVVITADQRSAVLVLLDDARREVGVTTIREGESLEGYRLAAVEPSRVLLEQRGIQFSVPVGRPYDGLKVAPDAGTRTVTPIFIPAPHRITPEVPYTGPQVNRRAGSAPSENSAGVPLEPAAQDVLQRLLESPQFRQAIEEMRPILRQRVDQARQDNQAAPDPPATTAKPSQ